MKNGFFFLVKVFIFNLQKYVKRLEEGVKTLKKMKGVNIVRYIDICETPNNIYLFLEFCKFFYSSYISS